MNRFNRQILDQAKRTCFYAGFSCFILLITSASATAMEVSANQQISTAITHYADQLLANRFQDFKVQIQPVDARLKLKPCPTPLQIQHRPHNRVTGRLTMKVSCDDKSPWRIHVPVQVQAFDTVVISKLPIAKGTQLTEQDVKEDLRDVSLLHNGYFKSAEQVSGFVAKRPIAADQVLNAIALKPAQMIDRGEQVVIMAVGSGLNIRTTGIAMDKGAYGELIRVRNSKTNKVIEGRITGPGQIKVSL